MLVGVCSLKCCESLNSMYSIKRLGSDCIRLPYTGIMGSR